MSFLVCILWKKRKTKKLIFWVSETNGGKGGGNFAIFSRRQNMSFCFFASIPKRITGFLVNRVEHQKRNQTSAELPFGWVFGVQLGRRQKKALITIYYIIIIKRRKMKIRGMKWRKLNMYILLLLIMMM